MFILLLRIYGPKVGGGEGLRWTRHTIHRVTDELEKDDAKTSFVF